MRHAVRFHSVQTAARESITASYHNIILLLTVWHGFPCDEIAADGERTHFGPKFILSIFVLSLGRSAKLVFQCLTLLAISEWVGHGFLNVWGILCRVTCRKLCVLGRVHLRSYDIFCDVMLNNVFLR